MRTKFSLFIFFLVVLSRGFAQADSTDISFTAVPFQQQSLEDSLTYGTGSLSTLQLEFEIDDLEDFGKVWVEVLGVDGEGNAQSVFYDSYTNVQLLAAEQISGSLVAIDLTILELVRDYQVVIRIEDTHGHEKISILKYL